MLKDYIDHGGDKIGFSFSKVPDFVSSMETDDLGTVFMTADKRLFVNRDTRWVEIVPED